MTQTIEVKFENVNTLASQLRAAGAVIKVAKGRVGAFVITITKSPILASIEEILIYSETSNSAKDTQQIPNEIVAFENVQIPAKTNIGLKNNTKSPTKENRKKLTKSKLKLEDLGTFDNEIPF